MLYRGCSEGDYSHSCHPSTVGDIAKYIYGIDLKAFGIGTGCFCQDNMCNAHPWDNLIETKGEKIFERTISTESRLSHATETDAKPTHATTTAATTIAAIIPEEEPRREHIPNSPNNAFVLHTRNHTPHIPAILIHFIISLITQY